MYAVPVTDDSCTGQKFKDPQQLQPEEIPPFSTLLVLKGGKAAVILWLLLNSMIKVDIHHLVPC